MKKPDWLKIKLANSTQTKEVNKILKQYDLHTVCEEANCPNRMECFSKKTATFMILGNICTRNCGFCNVSSGQVLEVDPNEPSHIVEAIKKMNLKYVVITSVTRDDLPDGGASQFVKVIEAIHAASLNIDIEVLIPDFLGNEKALSKVVSAHPKVINHNIETISRLYSQVRPEANYYRSLELLSHVKKLNPNIYTKSGFMLGLGETEDEVIEMMHDLYNYRCDILTIGQYLPPSKDHYPLSDYIHPDQFKKYQNLALEMGFMYVASSPLVRSSYNAIEAFK